MRKSFILSLLLFPFLLNAQSISLDYGKSSSSFMYKDSNGDESDNLTNKWGDVLSIKYTYPISDKFDLGLALQKNEYGAKFLDSGNNLMWDIWDEYHDKVDELQNITKNIKTNIT